jgi:hypothetical protein
MRPDRPPGPAPAARRLPLRIGTAMLGLFPHPSRANAARPRRGLRVVGCRAGLAPAGPAQIGGRSRGAGSRELARSAAVDPGPGGRLAVVELFARVGGSSVSLNCSCADQGGRHGDMVVGADRRGRCCVGVWCDAASGPLTGATPAARSRLALLLDQGDGLAVGPVGPGPAGAADHPVLPGLAGSCAQPGWGHARAATASSSLLEGPCRWPSKPSCAQGRSGLAWTTMARVTRGT